MFMEELEEELKTVGNRADARKWTPKKILRQVVDVASFSHSTKGKGRKWSVVTSLLVDIYRDEIGKQKSIENYKIYLASQSNGGGSNDSDDEGDFD